MMEQLINHGELLQLYAVQLAAHGSPTSWHGGNREGTRTVHTVHTGLQLQLQLSAVAGFPSPCSKILRSNFK
jgi:hypothetical protein